MPESNKPTGTDWRVKMYDVIFESDTPSGKAFDIVLLIAIFTSVIAVMLESVEIWQIEHGKLLRAIEWVFTILFTIEYVLRIACVQSKRKYIFSFFGLVDLIAIIPTYISLFFPGTQYLLVVRALRLLRVFRVLKLVRHVGEAEVLMEALRASRPKITVFLWAVMTIVIIVGTLMYLIEGKDSGFTSIPVSIYWAIVTRTTVGYGDIAPQSTLGQALAVCIMILGYGIIAVPTGIVSVEISQVGKSKKPKHVCPECAHAGHDQGAFYCNRCGTKLEKNTSS
jgi:voltage-gated potassium channel